MTLRWCACAMIALAGVGGVACSDEADDPSNTSVVSTTLLPETLDAAGHRSFLDGVCTDPDQGAVGDPVSDSSTVEEIDAQYAEIETRLDLMRALPVPSDEEAAFDEVVQAYDRVLTALDELSTAVADDDSQGAVLVASALDGLRADVSQLAADYGIDDCAL